VYRVLEAIVFSLCHVNLYIILLLLHCVSSTRNTEKMLYDDLISCRYIFKISRLSVYVMVIRHHRSKNCNQLCTFAAGLPQVKRNLMFESVHKEPSAQKIK